MTEHTKSPSPVPYTGELIHDLSTMVDGTLHGRVTKPCASGYLLTAEQAGTLLSVLKSAADIVQGNIENDARLGLSHRHGSYILESLLSLRGQIDNLPHVIVEEDRHV